MSNQKAILHYFDGRGKAEIIRLVMAASGVEVILIYNKNISLNYTQFRFIFKWETVVLREREQFLALKEGKLVFIFNKSIEKKELFNICVKKAAICFLAKFLWLSLKEKS
jgi:hypothetical protein